MKFTFVYVPADLAVPVEEKELEIPEGREVECLLDYIKEQMASSNPAASAQHTAARKQALLQRLPEGMKVPDDIMKAAGDMQLVETICLLSNSKQNGFVGVNMYVDDCGSLKKLPVNMRATDISHCCGRLTQVFGDAWIARILDNEHDFKRLDFKHSELSSDAPWVRVAHEQMQARLRSEAAETTISRIEAQARKQKQTSTTEVKELIPAEAAKEDGNKAFKSGDYDAAVEHYTKSLELDAKLLAARNNRAMALMKLGRWQEALVDCDAVLDQDGFNVKALLRKGEACRQLDKMQEARKAFAAVLQIEPTNKEAAAAIALLPALMTPPQEEVEGKVVELPPERLRKESL